MNVGKVNVFFLIVLVLACICCSGENAQGVNPGAKNFDLMPNESNLLFYANFAEVKGTPFGKQLQQRLEDKISEENDEEYEQFVQETGFDVSRDVREIWASVITDRNGKTRGGALVRAKYDKDRLIDFMKKDKDKFEEDSYKGYPIYFTDNEEEAFSFLNSDNIAVGHVIWIESLIDQMKEKKASVLDNSIMSGLIDRIPKDSQIWGVTDLNAFSGNWTEELRKRGSGFQGSKSLEHIETVILYSQIGNKAKTTIEGDFGTKEDAQLIADLLNGFKAMAKLSVSDDRETVDMLNAIQISVTGAVLTVSADLDEAFFEKVESNSKKFGSKRYDNM